MKSENKGTPREYLVCPLTKTAWPIFAIASPRAWP